MGYNIDAYSQPDYDDWGWDDYWDINDWKNWYDALEKQCVYNTLPIHMSKEEQTQLRKYRAIRARNLHKMEPIPVCKIDK